MGGGRGPRRAVHRDRELGQPGHLDAERSDEHRPRAVRLDLVRLPQLRVHPAARRVWAPRSGQRDRHVPIPVPQLRQPRSARRELHRRHQRRRGRPGRNPLVHARAHGRRRLGGRRTRAPTPRNPLEPPRSCTASWAASRWTDSATSRSVTPGPARTTRPVRTGTRASPRLSTQAGRPVTQQGSCRSPSSRPGRHGRTGRWRADTRWGDYYTMVVDPVDDCTFWYTGDYATTIRQSRGRQLPVLRLRHRPADHQDRRAGPARGRATGRLHDHRPQRRRRSGARTSSSPTHCLPRFDYQRTPTPAPGRRERNRHTDVPPRQHRRRCLDVVPDQGADRPDLGATAITNTATVTGGRTRPTRPTTRSSLTHLVNELADVSVTKLCKPDTGPAPAGTDGGLLDLRDERRPVDGAERGPGRHARGERAVHACRPPGLCDPRIHRDMRARRH